MKSKKEKTFSDKLEELKGKPGTIELTDKDKNEFVRGTDEFIRKESEKMENSMWFLMGIGIGIFGNFVIMLIYDWLKNLEYWQFVLMSILFILSFLLLSYIAVDRILEHRKDIKMMIQSRRMWKRAKNVKVGPATKMYEEDELEELKRDLSKGKYKDK